MYSLTQKLVAEFLGTFALIFFGAGSICADQYLRSSGGLGLLGTALAHGLAIGIMASALGHVSCGHYNPAITTGIWVTKRINTIEALRSWAAQLLGGVVAAFILKALIPDDTWRAVALGTPELARDFPVWAGMSLEPQTTSFSFPFFLPPPIVKKAAFKPTPASATAFTITTAILLPGPLPGRRRNP